MEGFGAPLGRPRCRAGRSSAALVATALLGLIAGAPPAHAGGFAVEPACTAPVPVYRPAGPLTGLARPVTERRPVRILAVGSSSTEGVGASGPDRTYPARLEADLRAVWGEAVSVRNAGIGGETAVQTVARLEALLQAERFDLVLWQVGTNDAVRGDDEAGFRALVDRGLDATRAAGVETVLIDPQYFPTIRNPARYAHYVGILAEVGAARRVALFSRYALMRAWSPEALAASLAPDGFHMADRGYDCLAGVLADALVGAVRAAPASVVATAPRR